MKKIFLILMLGAIPLLAEANKNYPFCRGVLWDQPSGMSSVKVYCILNKVFIEQRDVGSAHYEASYCQCIDNKKIGIALSGKVTEDYDYIIDMLYAKIN